MGEGRRARTVRDNGVGGAVASSRAAKALRAPPSGPPSLPLAFPPSSPAPSLPVPSLPQTTLWFPPFLSSLSPSTTASVSLLPPPAFSFFLLSLSSPFSSLFPSFPSKLHPNFPSDSSIHPADTGPTPNFHLYPPSRA